MTYRPKPACMLRNAMLHLKERQGASFAQIRKHLEQRSRSGAKLDPDHKRLLTNALRGLVRSGDVSKRGLMYVLKDQRHKPAETTEETPTKPHQQRTVPHRVPGGKYCKTHSKYHHARRRRRSHRRRRRRRHRRRKRHRRRSHRRRRKHRRRRNHKVGHRHGRHCKRHPGRGVHCHRRLRMVFPLRSSHKKRY